MAVRNGQSCAPADMRGWVQHNHREITALPEPGHEWIARDTEIGQHVFQQMMVHGVIQKVGSTGLGCGTYVNVYRTNPSAYDYLQQQINKQSIIDLPCCDHPSIKNERGVDGITCGSCGTVHPKEELQ